LIPLDFNSRRCNIYKKPGKGIPSLYPKVLQLVTSGSPLLRAHSNARNPNRLYRLLHGSLDTPGGALPIDAQVLSSFSTPAFTLPALRPDMICFIRS
jgi:hypothetical protein